MSTETDQRIIELEERVAKLEEQIKQQTPLPLNVPRLDTCPICGQFIGSGHFCPGPRALEDIYPGDWR
jgi:hypothetical protein